MVLYIYECNTQTDKHTHFGEFPNPNLQLTSNYKIIYLIRKVWFQENF